MRRLLVLTVLLALVLSLTGAVYAAKTERYAMVVFLKGSEFFNWAYAGMKDAAKMLGPNIKVELQGPAEWDAALEARAIDQLVAKKVNGIIVTAGEANALVPAINKAVDAGISVITFDSDAPKSKRLSFVGTNNFNAGYAAGKAMAEWLKGKGKVGISTFPGPAHLADRVRGFEAGLKAFGPEIKIVQTVNDEGDVAKAESAITAMLQAHPDINGIFAAHGNPGPGAAAAVRNLNMVGKVQIMGFDFGTPVLELIDKGEIRGTVGQDPYLMGYMAMILAYSANHKTSVVAQNPKFGHVPPGVDTGVTIIYKKDIAKYKKTPKI